MYEDLGLLTADEGITADISNLFNNLSGFARQRDYPHLLVAPESVRTGLVDRIEREIDHQRAGRPARIRIKLNSLVDEAIIDALYRASQAGVPVELWVRGICALRPGVPGLSENIKVRSILGRFLEHSRIFWFENGGEPQAWIGSADLMHRNLDRRVEVLVQIPTATHVDELGTCSTSGFDDGNVVVVAGGRRRLDPRTTGTPTAGPLRTSRPRRSPSTSAVATAGSTPKRAARLSSSLAGARVSRQRWRSGRRRTAARRGPGRGAAGCPATAASTSSRPRSRPPRRSRR